MNWHMSGEVVVSVENLSTDLTRERLVRIPPPASGILSGRLQLYILL